uniref:Uncharacterized protein n=1 Tax=Megaselia scalaris TaxID=36166 RepID=T1GTG9_MEGSC
MMQFGRLRKGLSFFTSKNLILEIGIDFKSADFDKPSKDLKSLYSIMRKLDGTDFQLLYNPVRNPFHCTTPDTIGTTVIWSLALGIDTSYRRFFLRNAKEALGMSGYAQPLCFFFEPKLRWGGSFFLFGQKNKYRRILI